MSSHVFTFWVWLFEVVFYTLAEHSGYNVPILSVTSRRHNFHHHKFTNCYGLLGFLDYLHGTDDDYRAMVEREQLEKAAS